MIPIILSCDANSVIYKKFNMRSKTEAPSTVRKSAGAIRRVGRVPSNNSTVVNLSTVSFFTKRKNTKKRNQGVWNITLVPI